MGARNRYGHRHLTQIDYARAMFDHGCQNRPSGGCIVDYFSDLGFHHLRIDLVVKMGNAGLSIGVVSDRPQEENRGSRLGTSYFRN